jgi:large subunit ribosomal protein L25
LVNTGLFLLKISIKTDIMETVAIKGLKRKETGKKATKALRREGLIPCAMYGMGDATHFAVSFKDVKSLIYTASFKLAEIDIDGSKHKCIVKERHFHPVSEEIEHIEFIELLDDRRVTVEVPVRLQGSAAGVRIGGLMQQNLRRITIKTTPEHLVNELVLDVTELEIGQSVRVRDIDGIEGVEIMNPAGSPVATIEVPRALRSQEAGAEGEEGEEGAVEDEGAEGAEGDASAE